MFGAETKFLLPAMKPERFKRTTYVCFGSIRAVHGRARGVSSYGVDTGRSGAHLISEEFELALSMNNIKLTVPILPSGVVEINFPVQTFFLVLQFFFLISRTLTYPSPIQFFTCKLRSCLLWNVVRIISFTEKFDIQQFIGSARIPADTFSTPGKESYCSRNPQVRIEFPNTPFRTQGSLNYNRM